MKTIVLGTLAAAVTAEKLVRRLARAAAELGVFPRAPRLVEDDVGITGRQIGGGIHAPPSVARTISLLPIVKHPTKTEWHVILVPRAVALLTWAASAQGEAALVPAYFTASQYTTVKNRITGALEEPSDLRPVTPLA
jgi:hypothetical protein